MRNQRFFQSNLFLGIIITLLGFFAWYSYHRIQNMIDSSNSINHSNLITLKIEEVLSSIKDAETSQRGFIITKDPKFLQPSIGAAQRTSIALKSLDSLVRNNEEQIDNFYKFRSAVILRISHLEKARNHVLSGAYNPNTLHSYLLEGIQMMDSVRNQAALMERTEQKILAQRIEQNQSNTFITPIITLTLSLLLLAMVISAFFVIRKRYNEQVKTKAELSVANKELTTSEDQFKGLLEHAPDAIVIVDKEGLIRIVNIQAEKMFGFEREELIGRRVEILLSEQLKEIHSQHRNNYFADPKFRAMGTDLELKGKRKDGSEFPVEISLSPLKTKSGVLVTAAIRDITMRKRTEEDLRQTTIEIHHKNTELQYSNAQLESFNYIASHDLKEPLRKIKLFAGKILESENEKISERGKDYFRRIENSSSQMEDLIVSIFNYSTLGREGLKFTEIDLNEIVEEIKKNFEHQDVIIHSEKLPVIFADGIQMHELFSNLIDNSIKYCKDDILPVINIAATLLKNYQPAGEINPKDFWKISVQDNGIGFDPVYNQKIFELFRRLHGKQEFSGTGIGLAICKKIVQNLGGYITAQGVKDGGAVFHIFVPQTS